MNLSNKSPADHIDKFNETFIPTREAGLKRLKEFAPLAGEIYSNKRNFDFSSIEKNSVSALSPWIKHRLITEEEVIIEILKYHNQHSAMKFIQEVFWRGYFKGWLEQHPTVWSHHNDKLIKEYSKLENNRFVKESYMSAVNGETGIECFDFWCEQLKSTGYLHNHVRMWFASIWVFTLKLPMELGADFFMLNLIDADAASNTLSWRWVSGLHTKGKAYAARASNIEKFTNGQFNPSGQLVENIEPLIENIDHPLVSLPQLHQSIEKDAILLLTEEDCSPETSLTGNNIEVEILPLYLDKKYPQWIKPSKSVRSFSDTAIQNTCHRLGKPNAEERNNTNWTDTILETSDRIGTKNIIIPKVPVGAVKSKLRKIKKNLAEHDIYINEHYKSYDMHTWQYASKGFFKLKKQIPNILHQLGLS
ncbi:DNA photolyase-like protein [Amylibacter sp.]|nr:DNA photolyase-like protein [Amylibacter sp.]MDC1420464.1 DNA photolyase-like protein [bacterium]MDB4071471.1 DNA photolyase-like protein [Amylibacter sp.]MDB4209025.1 DNA photolyase-like protein [Amylibacter sp.]MDC0087823.1 DNA photolyase-like protein [Amylibacter sp.]